jgi:hypothetical protein
MFDYLTIDLTLAVTFHSFHWYLTEYSTLAVFLHSKRRRKQIFVTIQKKRLTLTTPKPTQTFPTNNVTN